MLKRFLACASPFPTQPTSPMKPLLVRMSLVTLMLIALLALGLAACSGSSSSPTAVPAPLQPPSPQQQSLAGYVGDTAFRSVAGARIEVVDGPQAGMAVTSDGNGLFSYAGTFASAVTLRATKDGYIAVTKTTQTSVPGGRPWVYFQLEALAPPVNIAGDYTLSFIADSACTGIPNELRTRTYAATIAPQSNSLTRPDTLFTLTAGGAPFLESYHSVTVGVAGDFAAFMLYQGEGFGLVEQIAPRTYLGLYGEGRASVGTLAVSAISVPFDGAIEYCVQKSETSPSYDCNPTVAVTRELCQSKNHRLILTRR
jgi:hypothetical protein